jgi:hypothetical protein
MALETIRQQPRDRRDYDINFDEWWPDGDLISTVVMSSTPTGLATGYANSGQVLKVWIGPGTAGTYAVQAIVTSALGRVKDIDLKVRIKEE